jgi:hypothetical protein
MPKQTRIGAVLAELDAEILRYDAILDAMINADQNKIAAHVAQLKATRDYEAKHDAPPAPKRERKPRVRKPKPEPVPGLTV